MASQRSTASRSWRAEWPVAVSWALGAVLVTATLYGLLADGAYRAGRELEVMGFGQDVLTLAAVPVLVWAGHRSRAGSLRGHLLWLGLLAYVAYSYAIYAVGNPHNDAFLLYTAALGLSTAALLDGLARVDVPAAARAFTGIPTRWAGWLLIVTGSAFALLWLTDIVPTIPGDGLPASLGPGQAPFAVYVLDLAFALPAVVATGVLLVRGHVAGPVVGTVVMVKVVTLFLAGEAMTAALLLDGRAPDPAPTVVSSVLLVAFIVLLARGARRLAEPSAGWLRPTLWQPLTTAPGRPEPRPAISPNGRHPAVHTRRSR
jgi:hypothetical protein